MKILIRLPNWLGDMVMAAGFIEKLRNCYPGAAVSVIVKKGIHELLPFFPPLHHKFIFSKEEYRGMRGLWRFGRMIKQTDRFDLFFCLPDSFSSALMAKATGAKKRIGYKKELRNFLLTHTYTRPTGIHRVEEYIALLEHFTGKNIAVDKISLRHSFSKKDHLVLNINSEASSRRFTTTKAVQLLEQLRKELKEKIVLIGGAKEQSFVEHVLSLAEDRSNMESVAGRTSLPELTELLASAKAMLSTDSGPAHLANALGTPTVVLFGAGNENNTAPFNKDIRTVIRLGQLSCEPCTKNICVRFGTPQCLELLSPQEIIAAVQQKINR